MTTAEMMRQYRQLIEADRRYTQADLANAQEDMRATRDRMIAQQVAAREDNYQRMLRYMNAEYMKGVQWIPPVDPDLELDKGL